MSASKVCHSRHQRPTAVASVSHQTYRWLARAVRTVVTALSVLPSLIRMLPFMLLFVAPVVTDVLFVPVMVVAAAALMHTLLAMVPLVLVLAPAPVLMPAHFKMVMAVLMASLLISAKLVSSPLQRPFVGSARSGTVMLLADSKTQGTTNPQSALRRQV
ncbi:uncharacterized protein BDW70DRAFT_98650 [Aspergillus foveolatus]|uniref:uncharacterized protein n=1 Tax=Aspergillus foveolatus TaxID=210207 RepID=UPI003CCD606B